MKEKILELRQAGKSYNEICKILGCSKGTVSYHCGKNQKQKKLERTRKLRKELVILKRVERFQCTRIRNKASRFQRIINENHVQFNYIDVIEKFGWETICYLTGRKINLKNAEEYHFDHIVARSKGGSSTIDNLGILCKEANQAKHNLSVEDLLKLCKEILEYNGYKVQNTNTNIETTIMPCNSNYLEASLHEKESKKIAELLIYLFNSLEKPINPEITAAANNYYGNVSLIHEFTALICKTIRDLTEDQKNKWLYDGRNSSARKLADWWEIHQKADEERIKKEEREIHLKKVRDKLLASLDDEQRESLGDLIG